MTSYHTTKPEHIDLETAIADMTKQLSDYLTQRQFKPSLLVGIQTGGVWLAERLAVTLNPHSPIGSLNISFYRDDFTQKGLHPTVEPSQLPFSIENKHVVLVDDVIMSGRTIRAALNELFDYGRPSSVTLAVLIDLKANELPIKPDFVGLNLNLKPGQRVKLKGPKPLALEFNEPII